MSRHACAGQRTACGSLSFYPEVFGLNSEWQALCQTFSPAAAAPWPHFRLQEVLHLHYAFIPVVKIVLAFPFLQNFLLLDELPQRKAQEPCDGKAIVHVQDFTAFWDKVTNPRDFQDIMGDPDETEFGQFYKVYERQSALKIL